MKIGTRKLAEERWEAFYIEKGKPSDFWQAAEGKSEAQAIRNLKMS